MNDIFISSNSFFWFYIKIFLFRPNINYAQNIKYVIHVPVYGQKPGDVIHTKINTPLKNESNQHLLGGDGHDQMSHGISQSTTLATKITKPDSNEDEVRPMTIKEKLRSKLLSSKPPYDK